ncbi:hypothetical protein [Methylobacterium sp. 37f]|uniref:hypothetical protein n=1 Tax=Methylobacterium sp. 37f TaxID=2817058 RepID=UPI001FFD2E83|nr:hypothetical protein [Methylobacterium sp. 37f]MCK2055480.1 hypothetical protein [Methylobacterium sp. 37f]
MAQDIKKPVEYSQYYNLESLIVGRLRDKDYNGALEDLLNFVTLVMNRQYPPGELIGSKKLDRLCEKIGLIFHEEFYQNIAHKDEFIPNDDVTVIICTGLFKSGGTSPLIGDIVRAQGRRKSTVLATNSLGSMSADDLAMSRLGEIDANIIVCDKGNLLDRLHWLVQQITRLEPSRIILLNHHQDSVVIAAARPFTEKTKVLFYHHADHNLCLGVHLKGAIHVDIHNVGFCNCREKEQVRNNFYIPMTVNDLGSDFVRQDFLSKNRLTTCSSASPHKFSNFYFYPYHELIIDRLEARNGSHVHIGVMSEGALQHMHSKMIERSIDPSRLVYIPWTANLWKALIENNVDLFIGSFPIGGARTAIEVMGAGVPMLMHENYLTRFHSSRDIAYAGHFLWQYPHEFIKVISEITVEDLREHGERSRDYYLKYHCTEEIGLEEELNRICNGTSTTRPAPLYPHHPDMLDRSLHFSYLEDMAIGLSIRHDRATHVVSAAAPAIPPLVPHHSPPLSLTQKTSKVIGRSTVRTYRKARSLIPWLSNR